MTQVNEQERQCNLNRSLGDLFEELELYGAATKSPGSVSSLLLTSAFSRT